MKRVLFGILLLLASFSYAQTTGAIGGKVLDGEMFNEPLLMATVGLKNTDWSAQTNFNGNFEITEVTPGSYILEIRFLGYEKMELPIEIVANEKVEIQQAINAHTTPVFSVTETTDKEIASLSAMAPELQKIRK